MSGNLFEKWECANNDCELYGEKKRLGPGNILTTWTCRLCKTVMRRSNLR